MLRDAYARWPLFAAMIDNVEMSLAKTDVRLAERYLALGDRDDLRDLVLDEMDLTRDWVLRTTGNAELLGAPSGAAARRAPAQPVRRRALAAAAAGAARPAIG